MVYLPEDTAVCVYVDGVMVFPAWVVSCLVALLVPELTYPADWVAEAVIKPLELTEMLGVAWVTVATDLLTWEG